MTNIQARRVREIKALSGVVAALSLPVYGSAAFFDAWDGRFVSLYVGSVILTIAIGLQIYVRRPAAFGVTEIGDSLRTSYAAPAANGLSAGQPAAPWLARASADAPTARVGRKELLLQVAMTITVVTVYAVTVLAVSAVLVISPGWAFFVAAGVFLAVAFWIGRGFVVGAAGPMAAPATVAEAVTLPATPTTTTPNAA